MLSASFEREGEAIPARGTLSLYIRQQKVGSGAITTQPGKFGLGCAGLLIGRSADTGN